MSRLLRGGLALLVGAAVVAAVPASAKPVPSVVKATVWAHLPTAAEYRISSGGYTSVSGGGDVVVRRSGVGAYRLILEGQASTTGGVAHVSPYGGVPVFCTVAASYASWKPGTTPNAPLAGDHVIDVRCFDAAGAAVDSRFVAVYTNVRSVSQAHLVYLTTDQAVPTGVRTVPASMGYNSTGAPITYERLGPGRYRINYGSYPSGVPLVPATARNVTAYGTAAAHCQPYLGNGWEVQCVNADGMLVDSRFTWTYSTLVDLVGNGATTRFSTSYSRIGNINESGVRPNSTNTAISETYPWHGVTGVLLGTGRYSFTVEMMATSYGIAHVNSAGSTASPRGYCVVGGWGQSGVDERVLVNCFEYGGTPANLDMWMSFTTWPAG